MMLIGYARTSSTDHAIELAVQERALTSFGVERIFTEQGSPTAKRSVLSACLGFLRENDSLVVTTPGRLARSATELLAIVTDLDKRSIGLTILSFGGQPFETRFSQPTLAILTGVADWEREIALERQRGRFPEVRSAGRYRGRRPSINADEVTALVGTMSVTKIARALNISRSSAYRLLQKVPRTA